MHFAGIDGVEMRSEGGEVIDVLKGCVLAYGVLHKHRPIRLPRGSSARPPSAFADVLSFGAMDLTSGTFLSLPAVAIIMAAVFLKAGAVAFVLGRFPGLSERAFRAWLLVLLLAAWALTVAVAAAIRSTA